MTSIRTLEEISLNAWEAHRSTFYDGWVLRFSDGYTRRANSVQPLYPSLLPLPEKLTKCEAYYNRRGLPTVFKLTDAAEPPELDDVLAGAGYVVSSPTNVLSLPLADAPTEPDLPPGALDVRTYPSTVWLDTFCELSEMDPAHYPTARAMLLQPPTGEMAFALVWHGATPVGTGFVAMERGYAGVYDLVISSQYRRQGYGRRLLVSLLNAARKARAHTAYLQVTEANGVARALYDDIGFAGAYTYWYRVQNGT